MPALYSVAANLPHNCRKLLAIEALAGNDPISRIAVREDVSRKFLYQQKQKAEAALDQAFSPDNKVSDVLFYLPVTKAWLIQLVISLALICHSSYRGIIQLLADLFDTAISLGTVHSLLVSAASQATRINGSQDLSGIRVGLQDEIFQGDQSALMHRQSIAISWLKRNIATKTPGAYIYWMPRRRGLTPTIPSLMPVLDCEPGSGQKPGRTLDRKATSALAGTSRLRAVPASAYPRLKTFGLSCQMVITLIKMRVGLLLSLLPKMSPF